MSLVIRKFIIQLSTKESLLLLGLFTLAVHGIIIPLAEGDLRAVSEGQQDISGLLYFSTASLAHDLEQFSDAGKSLYRFFLLSAGLAARTSLFSLLSLLALWLKREKRFWSAVSPWFFPLIFLCCAYLEIGLLLFLIPLPAVDFPFLLQLTVIISWLKWISLFVSILSLLIVFKK
ncbi:MAG: hypothetical protein KDC34_06410 [Saprospiraceae bacterium]|nr:hypothetical protein [Saprospiraceae bacterium]